MEHAAFERLKLLVRALELHAEEIVGALCEPAVAVPTATTAVLRDGMSELAVAAAAVDTSRYDALVACGRCRRPTRRRLAAILDRSSLRVPSEAHVHDLLLTHLGGEERRNKPTEPMGDVPLHLPTAGSARRARRAAKRAGEVARARVCAARGGEWWRWPRSSRWLRAGKDGRGRGGTAQAA